MAKIVTLSDVKITNININIEGEFVLVGYQMLDDTGQSWVQGEAIFWRNIPEQTGPDGNPLPTPDNWYQLPASYLPTLVQLRDDARTAIINKVLA